ATVPAPKVPGVNTSVPERCDAPSGARAAVPWLRPQIVMVVCAPAGASACGCGHGESLAAGSPVTAPVTSNTWAVVNSAKGCAGFAFDAPWPGNASASSTCTFHDPAESAAAGAVLATSENFEDVRFGAMSSPVPALLEYVHEV